MSLHSLSRRRPSAAMVVSVVALFVSLGGVGWAAVTLPAGSVGAAQLQNASVTNWKILNGSVGNFKLAFGAVGPRKMENGAVGSAQINANQVQSRVTGTCSGAGGAIGSINSTGNVQCVSTPPQEFGTSSTTPVPLGAGSTTIATKVLPGGSSYLVLAYPHAQITGASAQQVQVDCTLSVSPSTTASTLTRSLTVDLGSHSQAGTIPLVVPAPSSAGGVSASVSCSDLHTTGPTPTVDVVTTINAIQTASNG
jgi:hypothetical protein